MRQETFLFIQLFLSIYLSIFEQKNTHLSREKSDSGYDFLLLYIRVNYTAIL